MKTIKPPENFEYATEKWYKTFTPSLFLAGSISGDNGMAEEWQREIEEELKNDDVIILNPRRNNWDNLWKQEISNPQFNEQVNWELDALNYSDHICMYLDPNTKSPISLLELGLYADSEKIIVCCPDGFWRKGNVEIVCQRNFIPFTDNKKDFIKSIRIRLDL